MLRLTYFGVHLNQPGKPKPYLAQLKHGGKMVYLGSFATAEVAALCIARTCHRAVARGAGGGKASGGGGATTERGGGQGRSRLYAARRFRQGGGHATSPCRQKEEGAVPPMPSDAFPKTEAVVKEEEGSGSRPKRQRTK